MTSSKKIKENQRNCVMEGMQRGGFVVAGEAYAKMAMHAGKYPHHPVCGVLLGADATSRKQKTNGSSPSSSSSSIRIVDYVPFFHGAPLAPMLEAAMLLVPGPSTK